MKITLLDNYTREPLDLQKIIKSAIPDNTIKIFEDKDNLERLRQSLGIKNTEEKLKELQVSLKNLNIPITLEDKIKKLKQDNEILLRAINPEKKLKQEIEKINKNTLNKLVEDFKQKNENSIKKVMQTFDNLNYYKNINTFTSDWTKYYQELLKKFQQNISFIQDVNNKIPIKETDESYLLEEKVVMLNNTALVIEKELKHQYQMELTKELMETIIINLKSFYIDSTYKRSLKTSSVAYFLKLLKEANLNFIMKYSNYYIYFSLFEIIEKLLEFLEKLEEIIKYCEKTKKCFIDSFNFALEKVDAQKYQIIREVYNNELPRTKYKRIVGIINHIIRKNNILSAPLLEIFAYLISKNDRKSTKKQLNKYINTNIENILNKSSIILTA